MNFGAIALIQADQPIQFKKTLILLCYPCSKYEMRDLHEAAMHGQAERIEKLVQSEEELNQHDNGHHALWYAVRAGQVVFIQKLLKFAQERGWQIIEKPSLVNDSAFDLAVRSNNFFCMQALALQLPPPENIFPFERAHIHKLNQIPLTVIALTKDVKRKKSLLAQALLEAMKYPGVDENILRIKLLLELGANPHVLSFNGEEFICPLAIIAGRYSASREDKLPEKTEKTEKTKKPLLPILLASLNSKTINRRREFYESSIREFFAEEIALKQKELTEQDLREYLLHGKNGMLVAKWGSGGGFLHWAAAMGHSEILDDIIESFYAHNYQTKMFYPDDYGNTPLTCALLAGHEDIAKHLLVEELRQVSLRGNMWLKNEEDQVYLLKFLNSEEINANLEFYQRSLDEFFRRKDGRGASILHWAAYSGHSKIIPCIIECLRTHGIRLRHTNQDKKTPSALAKKGVIRILWNY